MKNELLQLAADVEGQRLRYNIVADRLRELADPLPDEALTHEHAHLHVYEDQPDTDESHEHTHPDFASKDEHEHEHDEDGVPAPTSAAAASIPTVRAGDSFE